MKKRLLFICLLIFVSLCFFACTKVKEKTEQEEDKVIILPDLYGKSRSEIKEELDNLGVNYNFKFDYTIITREDNRDKFTRYQVPFYAGAEFGKDDFVYVYTTTLDITYYVHDQVKLDRDYVGKSFIEDGIGEATLVQNIDGDTAWFRDINGEMFKLRFYAVDTPESTKEHDPWGTAASNFTARVLNNAKVIVCEREENHVSDIYDRLLGYVWADGVLLNLWLVEECYTYAAASSSKYADFFYDAALHAKMTGRRIYGEIDPDYHYGN